MMQRAAKLLAYDEPFHKLRVVVRTISSHREEFTAASHQDGIFIAHLTLNHPSIANAVNRNSRRDIGCCLAFHERPPTLIDDTKFRNDAGHFCLFLSFGKVRSAKR